MTATMPPPSSSARKSKDKSQAQPFIRNLASSSLQTRRRALSTLRTYLGSGKKFSYSDFLKLWKGLFYCLYMTPGARVQQSLCRELGELVPVLYAKTQKEGQGNSEAHDKAETVLSFLAAFWDTMAREWSGLDKLRLDKFLFLCRIYIRAGFQAALDLSPSSSLPQQPDVTSGQWNDELLEQYLKRLETGPLDPRDQKIPNGLKFHILDVWVDELCAVDADRNVDSDLALRPIRKIAKEAPLKHVRARAEEVLADERLGEWKQGGNGGQSDISDAEAGRSTAAVEGHDEDGDEEDDNWGGFDD